MGLSNEIRQRLRLIAEAKNETGIEILLKKAEKEKFFHDLVVFIFTNKNTKSNEWLMIKGSEKISLFIEKRRGKNFSYNLDNIKKDVMARAGLGFVNSRLDDSFVPNALINPLTENFAKMYLLSWSKPLMFNLIQKVLDSTQKDEKFFKARLEKLHETMAFFVAGLPEEHTVDKVKTLFYTMHYGYSQARTIWESIKDKEKIWEEFLSCGQNKAPEGGWLLELQKLNNHMETKRCSEAEKEFVAEWRARQTEKHLGLSSKPQPPKRKI